MSDTLMQASNQWRSRPDDERFLSLVALDTACKGWREASVARVLPNRQIQAQPTDDGGLGIVGPNGAPVLPTHWSFGQLSTLAGAPAGYLRDLPPPLAADCLNFGLKTRDVTEIGVLLRKPKDGPPVLAAATGPNYGRIWNHQITSALVKRFGDGRTGAFRIPGEFGKDVEVNKASTTLYASDRDMFVFLADERNRIEVPERRNGRPGSLARGFFVWNSEVGSAVFGIATFLFDYVCANRIVWGSQDYKEIRIRHTSGAPDRYIEEVRPALEAYAQSSTRSVTDAIKLARSRVLKDKVAEFLATRFTKSQANMIQTAHMADEGRPIENLWDCVVGATAYARSIPWQDERVKVERTAGLLMAA